MTLLRANQIQSSTFDRDRMAALIDQNTATRGWLIFYTHGIEPQPGPYDTNPDDLAWILRRCQQAQGEILHVAAAYERIKASAT